MVLDPSTGSDSFGDELTREPWVERARSRAKGGYQEARPADPESGVAEHAPSGRAQGHQG
jgi:hypothetical protein